MYRGKLLVLAVVAALMLTCVNAEVCSAYERCGGIIRNGDAGNTTWSECSGCEEGYVCYQKNVDYWYCEEPEKTPPSPPTTPTLTTPNSTVTNVTAPPTPSGFTPKPSLATPSGSNAFASCSFNTLSAASLVLLLAAYMWQ